MADLRTGKRFPLRLPIRLKDQEHGETATGRTNNLSVAGAYISIDSDVQIGSDIDFEMTVPANTIGTQQDMIVRCHGRVVRNDPDGEKTAGLACLIDTYEFVRAVGK